MSVQTAKLLSGIFAQRTAQQWESELLPQGIG